MFYVGDIMAGDPTQALELAKKSELSSYRSLRKSMKDSRTLLKDTRKELHEIHKNNPERIPELLNKMEEDMVVEFRDFIYDFKYMIFTLRHIEEAEKKEGDMGARTHEKHKGEIEKELHILSRELKSLIRIEGHNLN